MFLVIAAFVAAFAVGTGLYYALTSNTARFRTRDEQPTQQVTLTTAEEGRAIPVLWGMLQIRGPNVVWYGNSEFHPDDYHSTPLPQYEHFSCDMHLALCHGPIDRITQVWVGDRLLLEYEFKRNFYWHQPGLYFTRRQYDFFESPVGKALGASDYGFWAQEPGNVPGPAEIPDSEGLQLTWTASREDLDVQYAGWITPLFGGPTQPESLADPETAALLSSANMYLRHAQTPGGEAVDSYSWGDVTDLDLTDPNYRGITTVFLRDFLSPTNTPKELSFTCQRIFVTKNGDDVWYPLKAAIGYASKRRIYIAIDSTTEIDSQERLEGIKLGVVTFLSSFLSLDSPSECSIRIVEFGSTATGIERENVDPVKAQELIDWVESIAKREEQGYFVLDYNVGAQSAQAFFAAQEGVQKLAIFIAGADSQTGTAEAIEYLAEARVYGVLVETSDFYSMVQIDNTPTVIGGRPGSLATNPDLLRAGDAVGLHRILLTLACERLDMNPAHIVRECLLDDVWGMGANAEDVDDASFAAAADQLHAEGLGLSLLWDKQATIEDFLRMVLDHIDATLRINRHTGKFELKLIRDDFDPEELLQLDPENVSSCQDFTASVFGDAVNSVTVKFTDQSVRPPREDSVTLHNTALVSQLHLTSTQSVSYPGFATRRAATKAALRDLRSISSPLASCTIVANREARNLHVGDPFLLSWPDYQIDNLIMRVVSIAYGNGLSNEVRIRAVEDAFDLPDVPANVDLIGSEWSDPGDIEPEPSPAVDLVELPHFQLWATYGAQLTDELTADPLMGRLAGLAERPGSGYLGAQFVVDTTTLPGNFAFTGTLTEDVAPSATVLELTLASRQWDRLAALPQWGQLGTGVDAELVLIESKDEIAAEVTVSRGIFDTAPKAWPAGTRLWAVGSSGLELGIWTQDDEVTLRVQTTTPQGTLPLADATEASLELEARAIRPLRPANLRVNGQPFPTGIQAEPFEVTWASRNRLLEVIAGLREWTDSTNVALEAGATFHYEVFERDALGVDNSVDTGTTGTDLDLEIDPEDLTLSEDSIALVVEVWSERSTYVSWQRAAIEIPMFSVSTELDGPQDFEASAF